MSENGLKPGLLMDRRQLGLHAVLQIKRCSEGNNDRQIRRARTSSAEIAAKTGPL